MALTTYTIEQAAQDIAALRGQVDLLNEALMMKDAAFDPNQTSGGFTQFSQNGEAAYVSGSDGGLYGMGVQISYLASDATQCSSTTQTDTGLSVKVASGITYWFDADIVVAAQSANGMYITMSGPTVTSFAAWIKYEQLLLTPANSALHLTKFQSTIGTNTGLNMTMINGDLYCVNIKGHVTPSNTTNLKISQAATANAASFTVKQHSVLRLYVIPQ